MGYDHLITIDPAIKLGKPVIAGTRITVELILDKLAAGETVEQLLDDYPQLTGEAIQAVFKYAADTLRNEAVYPLAEATS